MSSAVLLLSGGLDSTTLLAQATTQGYTINALTFRYGQRHTHEIESAKATAARYHVACHEIIDIDLRVFGGSALTANIDVPKDRPVDTSDDIPVTYVPARNTIFLAYALAYAEVTGSNDIFIGVNSLDYSGYPDCRPEYIQAFEHMANLATKAGVEGTKIHIRAPFLNLTKRGIITLGLSLGVDYSETISCYDPGPNGEACGRCDACQLRLKGFSEAGHSDPARYAES